LCLHLVRRDRGAAAAAELARWKRRCAASRGWSGSIHPQPRRCLG
jgi:hypothetical protein